MADAKAQEESLGQILKRGSSLEQTDPHICSLHHSIQILTRLTGTGLLRELALLGPGSSHTQCFL